MAKDKKALRDLFNKKTSDLPEDEVVEEGIVEETEEAPVEEAPAEEAPAEEISAEGGRDVVKEVKDIYMRWEESEDPKAGLDTLIGELQELRNNTGDEEVFLSGEDAPINAPMNI